MRPAPFFLVKLLPTEPNFGHFQKRKTKRNDVAKLFFTLIDSFNVKMSNVKAFPGIVVSLVYPFCFLLGLPFEFHYTAKYMETFMTAQSTPSERPLLESGRLPLVTTL